MAPRKKWLPFTDGKTNTASTAQASTSTAPVARREAGNTQQQLHSNAPAVHRLTHYGKTQAVILDHYRIGNGSIKRYSDEGIPYSDVKAGHGHKKWLDEKQRRVDKWTETLEQDDYTAARPATCLPPWVALSKYREYRKLYGERKHASNYPSRKSGTLKTGFMDLPPELRNRIYRTQFLLDEPVELLPKASKCTRKAPDNIEGYRWRRYAKIRKSVCALLRLNKAIRHEAGSIFYGENEFRFTGYFGWMYLRGFMDTIGPLNTSFLRNITVHIHWPGESTDASDKYQTIKDVKRGLEDKKHGLGGSSALIKTFRNTPTSFRECMAKFHEAGNLANLKLILPYNYRVKDVVDLELDPTKFRNPPKVTLVHLRRFLQSDRIDESQLAMKKYKRTYRRDRKAIEMKIEVISTWKNPKVYAKKQGWEYEVASYGETGQYPEVYFYGEEPGEVLESDDDDD